MASKKSARTSTSTTTKKATSTSRGAAKKTAAKKSASTKKAATKSPAKKAQAKKAATKKASVKKTAATKAPTAKKAAKKQTATKKPPTKKTADTKAPATKAQAKKAQAKKTSATKAPAKKSAATKAAPARTTARAGKLPVLPGEKPWTKKEVAELRSELTAERDRLRGEVEATELDIDALMREGGEGAGNDTADVGSNSFERDHEISIAANAREQIRLIDDALTRVDDGTFGVCESCGGPIGKLRLQAFPRATLCMACKRKQERR